MSKWDNLAKPANNALTMRLAQKCNHATWSWIRQSDKKVGISIEVYGLALDQISFPSSRNLEVSIKKYEGLDPMLVVICLNPDFIEIFEVLCLDLMKFTEKLETKVQLIRAITNRISIWHDLFKREFKGLSKSETLGLATEIKFLELWMTSPSSTIDDWEGPEDAPQDFVSRNRQVAVEIKATTWEFSTIKISSLYQLDFIGSLYLAVFPTKISSQETPNAINLPRLVDEVSSKIPEEFLETFENKLLIAGYISDFCATTFFEIGEPRFYKVTDEFPKLTTSNTPKPINSCSYSLLLSELGLFQDSISSIGL